MYCLWTYLANSHGLPKELIEYTFIHFYVPFEIAAREKAEIDKLYCLIIGNQSDWTFYNSGLRRLLDIEELTLDTRIQDDRIEKLVEIIRKVFPNNMGLPLSVMNVLKKGLISGNHRALTFLRLERGCQYRLYIYELECFMKHAMRDFTKLDWDTIESIHIISLLLYTDDTTNQVALDFIPKLSNYVNLLNKKID